MKKYVLGIALAMSSASVFAQVGVGTETPKATLDIVAKNASGTSTDVDGVLIPRVDRGRAQLMTGVSESTLIYVDKINTGSLNGQTKYVDEVGFYFFKVNGADEYWEKLNSSPKKEYAKPEFFYMPTVLLPTDNFDTRISTVTDSNAANYTGFYKEGDYFKVDLYYIFKEQFNTPVITSDQNTTNTLQNFVLSANEYDYVITYIDRDLFIDVTVTNTGVLSYKVDPASIITNGSFMNIVLKIK